MDRLHAESIDFLIGCLERMTIFPLVERELRLATRRPYAYRLRMGVATAAMLIAVWGLWAWSSWIAGAFVGHSLFRTLAGMAFAACLSSGILLTADGISRERREGTLGFLFLTDLRPADVVFGKLAAKAVLPFYALLALVPALAVFTVVGGVTAGEVWRTMLALANTLFVSLSVALFTSMLCTEQRLAHALACLAIAILTGNAVAVETFAPLSVPATLKAIIASVNLTTGFSFADEKQFRSGSLQFLVSLVSTHAVAWISLALACQMAPRAWREQQHDPKRLRETARREGRKTPFPSGTGRQTVLDANPITWMGTRDSSRINAVWVLPFTALLAWGSLSLMTSGPGQAVAMLVGAGVIQLVIRLWIALDASHTFNVSRRNGTLELLLGTPLSPREIGEGMALALRKRFVWPGVALAILGGGAAVYSAAGGNNVAGAALLAGALVLLIDIPCISWVGLWRGLAASGSTAATVSTLVRTLVLPVAWLILFRGLFIHSSGPELVGAYVVATLVNNLLFRASAQSRLCEHFRTLALRPYGAKAPHIESKWSPINWESEPCRAEEDSAAVYG